MQASPLSWSVNIGSPGRLLRTSVVSSVPFIGIAAFAAYIGLPPSADDDDDDDDDDNDDEKDDDDDDDDSDEDNGTPS